MTLFSRTGWQLCLSPLGAVAMDFVLVVSNYQYKLFDVQFGPLVFTRIC